MPAVHLIPLPDLFDPESWYQSGALGIQNAICDLIAYLSKLLVFNVLLKHSGVQAPNLAILDGSFDKRLKRALDDLIHD